MKNENPHQLNGRINRRVRGQNNDSMKAAARYLVFKKPTATAAECYENMTFKSGRLYRISTRSISLRKLEARMLRHPVFTLESTHPNTYSCTLKAYQEYYDDDPSYDWTDNKSTNRRVRNEK
tara:strand:- start:90 stop:455 length:366 start_codon:yes stop_codon:yes gene_type:complete